MLYSDGLLILGVSFAAAVLCEGLSWLLIYRTPSYKNTRASIDRMTKKVDTIKGKAPALAAQKSNKKKIDRFESSLKDANNSLFMSKIWVTLTLMMTLVLVFGLLNNLFDGKAVAKLPFKPLNLVKGITHRNLPGDDVTDCSMAFLYMLCSISIRQNLQKLLGFAPPRGAPGQNPFALPEPKLK